MDVDDVLFHGLTCGEDGLGYSDCGCDGKEGEEVEEMHRVPCL